MLNTNYTFSFNQPIDHTIVGSTITARHNELNLAMVSAGADFHHQNVRATLTLQYGSRPNLGAEQRRHDGARPVQPHRGAQIHP